MPAQLTEPAASGVGAADDDLTRDFQVEQTRSQRFVHGQVARVYRAAAMC